MKNDTTTTLLNFVLTVLVILTVVFACFFIWRSHNARQLQARVQVEAQGIQFASLKLQAILNDVVAYNSTAKSLELQQIIQSAQTPAQPAAK
ncbi:MAG: hypothetical protein P4N60_15850 [Verrucomicrobiae bacterium]|nr:hypothetical protein [Verrucomicrobiae bacterium]